MGDESIEIIDKKFQKIKVLIDDYDENRIVIPNLQRKYVWKQTQVCALFDSLYRNYPSGSILMWEQFDDANIKEDNLTKLSGAAIGSQKLHLLDGQQRITSLASVIKGKPVRIRKESTKSEVEEKKIDVYFNLDHNTIEAIETSDEMEEDDEREQDLKLENEKIKKIFQIKNKKIEHNKSWISVTDIFEVGSGSMLHKLGIKPDDDKYKFYEDRIKAVEAILKYEYPVIVLKSDVSYDEATRIFIRVNSGGTTLSGSDLALALISAKWRESTDLFEDFIVECEKERYRLDTGLIVRSLISVTSRQSRFRILEQINVEQLKKNWEKTKEGIKNTIAFLKQHGYIESSHLQRGKKLIPSSYLLIPLIIYSSEKELADNREKQRGFLKWFYMAAMFSRYGGSSETILDVDIKEVINEDGLLQAAYHGLLAKLNQVTNNKIAVSIADIENKQRNSPYFMMLYVLSLKSKSMDFETGRRVTSNVSTAKYKIEVDHIFPRAVLRKHIREEDKENLINDLCNLTFISKKSNGIKRAELPEMYLPRIRERFGPEILINHMIPLDPELWKLENYVDFLKARREIIVRKINELLVDNS